MLHNSKFREPVSGFTHLFGAVLSLIGLIVLVSMSYYMRSTKHIIAFSIFGISMILLYTASSVYHLITVSEKGIKVMRRVDHSMIYVLIAGTYAPICLIGLKGSMGKGLFITIYALATLGIILKMFWFNAPRWLYTSFYVFMGWVSIIAVVPLAKVIPNSGIAWLFAGGVLYTVGAVIYAAKWPHIKSKIFGFHEIFHIFVLMGSFCHYWLMIRYIMYVS
jgi:hemolysin III